MTPDKAEECLAVMRAAWPRFARDDVTTVVWMDLLVKGRSDVAGWALSSLTAEMIDPPSIAEWQAACREGIRHVRPPEIDDQGECLCGGTGWIDQPEAEAITAYTALYGPERARSMVTAGNVPVKPCSRHKKRLWDLWSEGHLKPGHQSWKCTVCIDHGLDTKRSDAQSHDQPVDQALGRQLVAQLRDTLAGVEPRPVRNGRV